MADKKGAPQNDFSIDEILAEARTLNGGEHSETKPRETYTGGPSEPEVQTRSSKITVNPESIAEQAKRALDAKTAAGQPSAAPEKGERKKRSLFGRSKREIPEIDGEEDLYYGLQLKSLQEYRDDYEKSILIDSTKIRNAESQSAFSYLFDQNDDRAVNPEISEQFEHLHNDRRKRVEQALSRADLEYDDVFSLYDDQPLISADSQPPVKPETNDSSSTDTPRPQEEPAKSPEQPPVPSPFVPTPGPTPTPRPEILPGPQRGPEIPMPLNEPTFQPGPAHPSEPTQPGYLPEMQYHEPENPVKEPVSVPQVKEETPHAPTVKEPPEKPVPFTARAGVKLPDYRPATGRPVHMIDLNDFSGVLLAEAKKYPMPEPEPLPAPIPIPVPELKAPVIMEQTSEFEAVRPQEPDETDADLQSVEPIQFPEPDLDLEEEFQPEDSPQPESSHPHKKRRFSLFGSEEEDNDNQEELHGELDELDDYSGPTDASSVFHDLGSSLRNLSLRLAVTGISTVLLFIFGFLGEYYGLLPQSVQVSLGMQPYLILNLVFLLVATAFCFGPVVNGMKGLFLFQANSDSAVALADIAAIIQSIALFFTQHSVQSGSIHLYSSLVVLALFLNTAGKWSMVSRINKNFHFVAAPDQKQAVQLFDDHNTALQMAKGCVIDSPVIAFQTKTNFLKHFLRLSYEPDPSDHSSQIMAPIGFVCSLVLCIVTLVLSKNMFDALTAFAAAACISVPFVNMLSVNLPLSRLSKIASRCGAMIVGFPAVEQFSNTNAVMVDAKDLFPKGTIILNGIKTFGGQRIDEAIVDATALMCAVGGPLSDLFDQIIKSRHDMLPNIDNPAYEDDKGVIGWVSGRRILVGNRTLMESHSIEPPSRDYEEKYIHGGKKIIYLASNGDLVAMFVVSYNSDRRRALELRRMEDNGISLIVRTCDPNITPSLLADCFGLDEHCVRVLPERLGSIYQELTAVPQERSAALLATKGRATAMLRLLTACIRQRSNISVAVALQNIAVILGILLVGFLACYSGLQQLSTSALLLYEVFWAAAIWFIPRLRKP